MRHIVLVNWLNSRMSIQVLFWDQRAQPIELYGTHWHPSICLRGTDLNLARPQTQICGSKSHALGLNTSFTQSAKPRSSKVRKKKEQVRGREASEQWGTTLCWHSFLDEHRQQQPITQIYVGGSSVHHPLPPLLAQTISSSLEVSPYSHTRWKLCNFRFGVFLWWYGFWVLQACHGRWTRSPWKTLSLPSGRSLKVKFPALWTNLATQFTYSSSVIYVFGERSKWSLAIMFQWVRSYALQSWIFYIINDRLDSII